MLLIPHGPGAGGDLALVDGAASQIIGRNVSKELWTYDQMKNHMLSPKGKTKNGTEARRDFSPERKQLFKGELS